MAAQLTNTERLQMARAAFAVDVLALIKPANIPTALVTSTSVPCGG